MQVFKFGGASVKDAASVVNVADIVEANQEGPTVVVVSAMGKITNRLENLVQAYFDKSDTTAIIRDIEAFHLTIMNGLFAKNDNVFDEVSNVFTELSWAVEEPPISDYNFHYDQVVSLGEVISSKIVAAYFNKRNIRTRWMDARGLIQTDNSYREGKVNYELSEKLVTSTLMPVFKDVSIVLTQGFVGGTSENYTTTLGREGSDYSAALLAYFTNAAKVVIWKDVAGVLNADPKYFANTKKIDQLSYHDAIELTYYGASVIHPKTIKPLQNRSIPLHVRSFLKPADAGTVIKDVETRVSVTSYIFKDNQILISIQPKDFSFIAEENLSEIFAIFSKHNAHIHMMQNSAISFSVCTDNEERKIVPLMIELKEHFKVLYNDGVQLMTIRNYNPEIISKLSENREVLIEQRSRHTHQMVMRK